MRYFVSRYTRPLLVEPYFLCLSSLLKQKRRAKHKFKSTEKQLISKQNIQREFGRNFESLGAGAKFLN